MGRTVSQEVVRRAQKLDEAAALICLDEQNRSTIPSVHFLPWIVDINNTVKPLYGHQEGAEIGYLRHKNPDAPVTTTTATLWPTCGSPPGWRCCPANSTPPNWECPARFWVYPGRRRHAAGRRRRNSCRVSVRISKPAESRAAGSGTGTSSPLLRI